MISILFDLDGTLMDTSEGIIKGIEAAEKKLQLGPLSRETKRTFIGPPLKESFILYYGLTEAQSIEAVKAFREYYADKGKYECVPYHGIRELLINLTKNNIKTFVATSKPTVFAKDIIAYYEMEELFTDIVGSNLDSSRSKKKEIIQFILSQYDCVPKYTIMIGDKKQDIEGAKQNGIHSIGVTYGFGSSDEIEKSKPDKIADSVNTICLYLDELGWW